MNKLPPQAIEAEESLLSYCIVEGINEKILSLSSNDFYRSAHQKIFSAILKLSSLGTKIDLVTLVGQLRTDGILEECGGASFIARLIDTVPTNEGADQYCGIIQDKSAKRKLIAQHNEIINACFDDLPVDQIAIEQRKICEIAIPIEKSRMIKQVQDWIDASPGEFSVLDIDRDLSIKEPWEKILRTAALEQLLRNGIIERSGNRRGWYRPCESVLVRQDFANCDGRPVDIWLPFEITSKVDLYRRNIITLGGEKNAGKTALMLNIAYCNRNKFKVHYFNSEMGDQELRARILRFENSDFNEWRKIEFYERARNFSDVIFRGENDLNVIDFLELSDEFWKVGQLVRNIHDNMGDSMVIIALQKKSGADNPRGGEFVKEKSRLHMDLTNDFDSDFRHKLKINPGKNWHTSVNPNGHFVKFKIAQGCVLSPVRDFDGSILWHERENIKKAKTI